MNNDLAVSDVVKILVGFVLLGTWIAMRYLNVANSNDIIEFCKLGLTGLSAHYLTNLAPSAGTTIITGAKQ